MKTHFNNLISSSLLLYLDNRILTNAQSFTNYSSLFYSGRNRFGSYYTYSLPYSQVVYDSSVPSCNVLTGVYLNNSLLTKGQSGYVDFNYDRGEAYFNQAITGTNLSGNYAIKDFSIRLTSESEVSVLLENKFSLRPKTSQTVTGLDGQYTYPAIFIKNKSDMLDPLQFGAGAECNKNNFSIYIFADSLYKLDNIVGTITDLTRTHFGLFSDNEFPFSSLGGLRTGTYDYVSESN